MNKLKIMSNCVYTIKEGREYKYQEGAIDLEKNRGEKPMDFNNHAMDVLRYVMQELPDNPDDLINDVYMSNRPSQYQKFKFPKALEDTEEPVPDNWYNTF
jgi:hypothetical protein